MSKPAKLPTATICLSPYAGGMERDAMAIAKNMGELSSNSVLITRAGTWLHQKAKENGVPVEPVSMSVHISLSGAMQLRRLWKKYHIGNIVFLGSSEMPTIFLSLLGMDINLVVRHGTTKNRSKKDFIHRLTWSKVKSHWCISEHIRNNVESIFPIDRKSVFVAYTSQSDKFPEIPLAPRKRASGQPLELVQIGRLHKRKGQRDAVSVLSHLAEVSVPANLTLYGDGPDYVYLVNMVERLGLRRRVNVFGEIEKPYRYLDKFDAFIFPSYGEGLPNGFLEAIYSGLPCFCYNNTVFQEISDLGLKFFMVKQGNRSALAREVLSFFDLGSDFGYKENRILMNKIFSATLEQSIVCKYLK